MHITAAYRVDILSYIDSSNLYLDKSYVKLAWNEKDQILVSYWDGFFSQAEIVAAGNRTIQIAKMELAKKILYDASKMELIDESSQDFIAGEFTRQMTEARIEYSATVMPEDKMARTSVEKIKSKIPALFDSHISYFPSFEKALSWLRKQL